MNEVFIVETVKIHIILSYHTCTKKIKMASETKRQPRRLLITMLPYKTYIASNNDVYRITVLLWKKLSMWSFRVLKRMGRG